MNVTDLTTLGWGDFFETNFKLFEQDGYVPGRVFLEHKGFFRVYTQYGEMLAEISGKLRHEAPNRSDLPAVGDWTVITPRPEGDRAMILAVLPRRTSFTRAQSNFVLDSINPQPLKSPQISAEFPV